MTEEEQNQQEQDEQLKEKAKTSGSKIWSLLGGKVKFWVIIGSLIFLLLLGLITAAMIMFSSDDCDDNSGPTINNNQIVGDWTSQGSTAYSNAQRIWTFWQGKGFSGAAISGILGNIAREGGFTIVDRAQGHFGDDENSNGISAGVEPIDGGGGPYQFTPYTKYAPLKDGKWLDLDAQNNFVWDSEAKSASWLQDYGHSKDPVKASRDWFKYYERGARYDQEKDVAATSAYQLFGGANISGGPIGDANDDSSTTENNDTNTAANDAADNGCDVSTTDSATSKYIFDESEQGFMLNDGVNGPAHGGKHDGWDINPLGHPSNPDGPAIYALKGGKIIQLQQGDKQTKMPLVVIKTSDNMVLVYQEFKADSEPKSLKVGSTIKAGDKIGESGSMFPDGQVNGALTPNGFVPVTGLGDAPGNATAISLGNHLHLSYKTYEKDDTSYPSWAADSRTQDPGVLFGLQMGLQSGSYKWSQLGGGTSNGLTENK